MNNSQEELEIILHQMCGCYFEKYLIEKHVEFIKQTSRKPLMAN